MLGAIIGDIVGSVYERKRIKTKEFELFSKASKFTDDTVLTIAIADAVLKKENYCIKIKEYARRYPNAGYGGLFRKWIKNSSLKPYGSYGNGSAMRVSPIGFAFKNEKEVLSNARESSNCTHNHPDAVKAAKAVALAIYLAKKGIRKQAIKETLSKKFEYNLDRKIADIRKHYKFDSSARGSVPEAIICFLESVSFEDAIRNAVSLGGDADTQACIAGAVAEAYYKNIPEYFIEEARKRLPKEFLNIIDEFYRIFPI